MTQGDPGPGARHDEWVPILAPRGRDAALIAEILRAEGIDGRVVASTEALSDAIRGGRCGACLITEESLTRAGLGALARVLGEQPAWSDFPFLVLTSGGAASEEERRRLEVLEPLGNVAFVERPVRRITLISAVRAALRARRRQYQVHDQIDARRRAEEALREADRRKDEFLATLAHELRNPMAPLRNGLEILRIAGHDAELVEQSRGMMERQLAQMTRLVDDLLDLSRIGRGKIELRIERLDLGEILRIAVEAARPLIDQSGHELAVAIPAEPIPVDGDAGRLTQVFANLLNNAAKYTPAGGHLGLTVERGGTEVRVSIVDDGIGIPAHLLPRVFEIFTQGTGVENAAPAGLGIGLSVVRRMVAMHGGDVEARSDGEGAGSTFVVRLPIAADVGSAGGGVETPGPIVLAPHPA